MKNILLFSWVMLGFSCARIPVQSVDLADAIQNEGSRMHMINIALITSIVNEKKSAVNKFIDNEYTPAYIENFKKGLPGNTDLKNDLSQIVQAVMPEINARRDSLIKELDKQKEKIINKLNEDYKVFDNAATTLKRLLESAAKVDEEKRAIFAKAKELTKNKIDFNSIEEAFGKFVTTAGNVGGGIVTLDKSINNFLNQ